MTQVLPSGLNANRAPVPIWDVPHNSVLLNFLGTGQFRVGKITYYIILRFQLDLFTLGYPLPLLIKTLEIALVNYMILGFIRENIFSRTYRLRVRTTSGP